MRISIRLVLIHFFADFQISFEMFFLIQQFPLNFFYYISPKFDYTYNKISKQNLLGRKEKQKRRKGITKFQLCRLAQEGSLPTKKYACCTTRQKRDIFQFHFVSLWYQSLAEVAPGFLYLKFIYSEKATKSFEISALLLSYVVPVKSNVEISQNFVAFSEYMNFIEQFLLLRRLFMNGYLLGKLFSRYMGKEKLQLCSLGLGEL